MSGNAATKPVSRLISSALPGAADVHRPPRKETPPYTNPPPPPRTIMFECKIRDRHRRSQSTRPASSRGLSSCPRYIDPFYIGAVNQRVIAGHLVVKNCRYKRWLYPALQKRNSGPRALRSHRPRFCLLFARGSSADSCRRQRRLILSYYGIGMTS